MRQWPGGPAAAVVLGLVLTLAAGCTTEVPDPSATPAPSASAAPSPSSPPADLTGFGQAERALADLIEAAGSAHAIKAEFDATSATLCVVIGQSAVTWGWRDGVVEPIETDTAYVGQAIFDPRTFNLSSLGRLFRLAASVTGSDRQQRLHIVEYADGHVYMTVTTNPESAPVFFRPDGSIVENLDFTTAAGLAAGLAETTGSGEAVLAVGLDATTGGVFAEAPGVAGQVTRTLRMPHLPPRATTPGEAIALTPFDVDLVDPAAILRVIERLPTLTGHTAGNVELTIDCRDGSDTPAMYFSLGGQSVKTTLSGVVLSV